jgi:hypothetical protein
MGFRPGRRGAVPGADEVGPVGGDRVARWTEDVWEWRWMDGY